MEWYEDDSYDYHCPHGRLREIFCDECESDAEETRSQEKG